MKFAINCSRVVLGIAGLLVFTSVAFTRSQPRLQTTPAAQAASRTQARPSPTPPKPQPSGEEIDPDDVIRVKTTLVNTPVLVIGRSGKYVPTLHRNDFQIFEDGIKQEIAYFAPVANPVTVAILIDTSRSALFDLKDIQDTAIAFVESMRPQDQALVITFADEISVLAEPTSDHDLLRRAIRHSRPGGATRLYDAIDFVLANRLDSLTGRKAVLLFSDGVDNASRSSTYESNLHNLTESDVLIYPIQLSSYERMKAQSGVNRSAAAPVGSGFNKQDYMRADSYLHLLADLSGTGVYPATEIRDIERAVASILEELHNEYSLGYYPRTPGQPGEVRRLEVRVSQRQLVVRARAGYVIDKTGAAVRVARSGSLMSVGSPASEASLPIPSTSKAELSPLGERWICKGPNVPTDFAVVKEGFDSHCPSSTRAGDITNAWLIRKPDQSEILCKGFVMWNGREIPGAPVPTGYVVIGEKVSQLCAKSGDAKDPANAWSIRLPRERETICKGFLIPRGYVVVNEARTSECPARTATNNAWVIAAKR